jgi:uncharacterized protein
VDIAERRFNHMKCPLDETQLVMSERQGIEIDYCPQCRGVWLDRGELDKIIDRSGESAASVRGGEPDRDRYDREHRADARRGYPKKKRKESFLSDLFDF